MSEPKVLFYQGRDAEELILPFSAVAIFLYALSGVTLISVGTVLIDMAHKQSAPFVEIFRTLIYFLGGGALLAAVAAGCVTISLLRKRKVYCRFPTSVNSDKQSGELGESFDHSQGFDQAA